MTEMLDTPVMYWHVVLPDYATDALVLVDESSGARMAAEGLDDGSIVDATHVKGGSWVHTGIHPLQRNVGVFFLAAAAVRTALKVEAVCNASGAQQQAMDLSVPAF